MLDDVVFADLLLTGLTRTGNASPCAPVTSEDHRIGERRDHDHGEVPAD